jgi:conjugative relaxase-like TrwC/TraI family protein
MLRVTTLFAGTAATTAAYYTAYLTQAEGELPGKWMGRQAAGFGLTGDVATDQLEALLLGRDPIDGTPLGKVFADRTKADGTVVRAVAGFDATLSAPKSLSAWWALTGDDRLAECHDVAVAAVVHQLERFGATTRIRHSGGRLHPDTQGLTIAAFRQSTSRADDPQLHTHLVISSKVQTDDGRWLALDARMLKGHQRAFGGLYQSVLRAELTHRFGVRFGDIVKGQAEVAGVPEALTDRFSKRTAEVDRAVVDKLAVFWEREGRDPTSVERAAITREAAADTRRHKTGGGVPDLRTRWRTEAKELGLSAASLTASIDSAAREVEPRSRTTAQEIIERLSTEQSAWHRIDVLRAVTDTVRPVAGQSGERWSAALDRAVNAVMSQCINLDPAREPSTRQRPSDERSIWIEPVARHMTSEAVLRQEEYILSFAADAQLADPAPSGTVRTVNLDDLQADAAASVAGHDRLVLVVGPAGTGKTTMLRAAVTDLERENRPAFGLAPTAKAAEVLRRGTGLESDTVAKLIHEWTRTDRSPEAAYRLPIGSTVVVDEAGMLNTFDLYTLTHLAERNGWRLALVGDPRQLSAVGRGGMFDELCATGRVVELQRVHRFADPWEASASLGLRRGDPRALDSYEGHGRIVAGPLAEHIATIADRWLDEHDNGKTLAITTTTNTHVDQINNAIQSRRVDRGDLQSDVSAEIAEGAWVYVGDIVATRLNDRRLRTETNEPVRNRDLWTATDIDNDGSLTVTKLHGHGTATLPPGYVIDHVRLGYAATEYGHQSITTDASISLATGVTTCRGLYVAMSRGRHDNTVHVVTDTHNPAEARDTLERVLANDRADLPAVSQRRQLATQDHAPVPSRPRLTPRCTVPPSFNDLLREAVAEVGDVERLIKEVPTRRVELVAALERAENAATAASRRHAPFAAARSEAGSELSEARQTRYQANINVGGSNALTRRRARRRLDEAEQGVDAALAKVDRVNEAARPTANALAAAEQAVRKSNDAIRQLDYAERYGHPDRLDKATRTIETLHTWHDWATGREVAVDSALDLAEQLPNTVEQHGLELLEPVESWLTDRGIEPPSAMRRIEARQWGFGIEM